MQDDPGDVVRKNRQHGRAPNKWQGGPHWPLIETLIQQRQNLGMSQWDVDFEAGWSMGYCGKLEAGMRRPGIDLFYEWATVLDCEIIILPQS